MPPKGTRKYNGKTRSGCRQCKRRRVKCDCVGPVCANCRRRQEHCSFLGLLATTLDEEAAAGAGGISSTVNSDGLAVVSLREAAAVAAHASSRDALSSSLPAEQLRADEAELKHHFFNHAWLTFSLLPDPRTCDVWSRWIPQLASRHIFIQQIMLCLSAAHICSLGRPDSKRYYELAYRYSIQASNCFRLAVRDMSEDNWILITMFSLCNGIFGYYRPFLDEKVMGIPCTMDPASTLNLMRLGGQFADSISGFIDRSPIRDKLRQVDPAGWAHDSQDIRTASQAKIARLEQWLHLGAEQTGLTAADTTTYLEALGSMAAWAKELPGGKPRIFCHIVAWPNLLPPEYISRLEADSTMALLIFILWSEIMAHVPQRWYLVPWFTRGHGIAIKTIQNQPQTPLHQYWASLVEDVEIHPPAAKLGGEITEYKPRSGMQIVEERGNNTREQTSGSETDPASATDSLPLTPVDVKKQQDDEDWVLLRDRMSMRQAPDKSNDGVKALGTTQREVPPQSLQFSQ